MFKQLSVDFMPRKFECVLKKKKIGCAFRSLLVLTCLTSIAVEVFRTLT